MYDRWGEIVEYYTELSRLKLQEFANPVNNSLLEHSEKRVD
jgi:hypothetical protein